jgi:hypothetical protein
LGQQGINNNCNPIHFYQGTQTEGDDLVPFTSLFCKNANKLFLLKCGCQMP